MGPGVPIHRKSRPPVIHRRAASASFSKPAGSPQSVADGLFGLFVEEMDLRVVDDDIDVVDTAEASETIGEEKTDETCTCETVPDEKFETESVETTVNVTEDQE